MKKLALAGLLAVILTGTTPLLAAEPPQMPVPVKEHKWLQKLAGEWQSDVSIFAEPGKPPMKAKSTERVRMVGGFWAVGEAKSQAMMGENYSSILTIGYDPAKKQYIGTWIDSMNNHLWKYTGSVDKTGKILTLNAQGPGMVPGKICNFKEVIEFKSNDHRLFTSFMQGEDGKWVKLLQFSSRRKK